MSSATVLDYLEQANKLASTLSGDEKAKARAEVAKARTAAIQAGAPTGIPAWVLVVGGIVVVGAVAYAVLR